MGLLLQSEVVTEQSLRDAFSAYGVVTDCTIKKSALDQVGDSNRVTAIINLLPSQFCYDCNYYYY